MLRKIILIIILVLIAFIVYLAIHPNYKINKIQFYEENFVPIASLEKVAEKYNHKNMFWTYISKNLSNEVLTQFPTILSLGIKLQIPGIMHITVNEKQPWATFFVAGKTILVANDGTILSRDVDAKIENLNDMMVVRGFSGSVVGAKTIDENCLKKVSKVVTTIENSLQKGAYQLDFGANPSINTQQNNLTIYMDDTLPIKVGDLNGLQKKLSDLQAFFNSKKEVINKISYIDLRALGKVIIKK
jgi:cell division septal protein FtsQ